MNHGMWCTKEDVLKDLEVASGRRVANVDEGFFVVGERPPPPRVLNDEDDELELRFGRATATQKSDKYDDGAPDLKGITSMLRMVEDYEYSSDDDQSKAAIEMPTSKNNVVVISKLNPNVKEFIPKQTFASQNIQNTKGSSKKVNVTDVKENLERIETASIETDTACNKVESIKHNTILAANKEPILDIAPTTSKDSIEANSAIHPKVINEQSEYNEMTAMLKNNISTAKKDSFEETRKTNVAIVKLLKLYAQRDSKVSEPKKILKLLPPQFFETCRAPESKITDEIASKNTESSIEPNKDSLLYVDDINNDMSRQNLWDLNKQEVITSVLKNETRSNSVTLIKEDKNIDESTSLTPEMAGAGIADHIDQKPIKHSDPEMQESVKKVTSWLENKPYSPKNKPKSAAVVYLAPVSFKRKDPVTCKSPSEIADKKIPKPADTSYKPSEYAEELLQKYKQRIEKKAPPLNIWEKLEEDLKRKDADIKNGKTKSVRQ